MRQLPPWSLLLPLAPYKTTPLRRLLMSRLSPPSLLLSRLFLPLFCSPPLSLMSRAAENARSFSRQRWVPVSDGPTPSRNDHVAPAVPFTSDRSKVPSFSNSGNGFPDSKRNKSSVALGGVDSGKPFKSDNYESEFPSLGISTGSKHKGYGRRSGVADIGLDQTMMQYASPSQSKNMQSRNWRNCGDFTSSRRNHLPFDICIPEDGGNMGVVKETHRTETEHTVEVSSKGVVLRPGMVLLKRYLTHDEQVDIVKICQRLGVGPGGFCRPGYRDGPKLRLQMMSLGLNWDPETKYAVKHSGTDCKPPNIPHVFIDLVERAIKDAHALIKEDSGTEDAESVIPGMSPDICIVNFYSATGGLGLHQDRDESRGSIRKGLPIVSFSIGDSAEFLYGEYRDVERAEKVTLESGDVLIFGGESRLVFHGVKSIIPNSASKRLLDDSKLRTGRLNLTFRKF